MVKSAKMPQKSAIFRVFCADLEQKNAFFEWFFFRCSPDI